MGAGSCLAAGALRSGCRCGCAVGSPPYGFKEQAVLVLAPHRPLMNFYSHVTLIFANYELWISGHLCETVGSPAHPCASCVLTDCTPALQSLMQVSSGRCSQRPSASSQGWLLFTQLDGAKCTDQQLVLEENEV